MATEKRLIERIAERLKDAYPQADRNNLCPAIYYDDFAEIVDDVLSEIGESVDAVEGVHAHWVEWWPGDCALIMTGEEMLYQCSACTAKFSDVEGFQYCPHCGALMEGINHAESDDQA